VSRAPAARRWPAAALAVAVSLWTAAAPADPTPAPSPPPASDRATVVVRYDCRSELDHRELTLFRNGTVRLRRGPPAATAEERLAAMRLAELAPEDLAAYLARLAAEDLAEVGMLPPGVDGSWVERCRLELRLPGAPPRDFEYGRYDALPLALSRVVRIVDELVERAADPLAVGERLPSGYRPRPGDVLRRADGERFTVVAYTSDRRGIEVAGVDQPVTLYLDLDTLTSTFVALESRRPE
jgi:hypothetical protein